MITITTLTRRGRRGGEEDHNRADHWFDTLVICEVNEKRGPKECNLAEDVIYRVGGAEVVGVRTAGKTGTGKKAATVTRITSAASYLKKNVCVNVGIPEDARILRRGDLVDWLSSQRAQGEKGGLETSLSYVGDGDEDDVGITLEMTVAGESAVSRDNGACSVSHVVWEQH